MKVRAELGRDAVILHSKKFRRGGAFGLFGRQMFEVIAAVEVAGEGAASRPLAKAAGAALESPSAGFVASTAVTETAVAPAAVQAVTAGLAAAPGNVVERVSFDRRENAGARVVRPEVKIGAMRVPVEGNAEPDAVPLLVRTRPQPDEIAETGVAKELAGLRHMIHELSTQVAARDSEVSVAPGWEALRRTLLEAEVDSRYVDQVEERVFRECRAEDLEKPASVAAAVRRYFLEHFLVERRASDHRPCGRRVVALVGPTGVGKTTTVAKLAARYSLFENQSVGLLTVDTYRIAAVDQLRTYADIINLPVEVAFSPDEVPQALARLSDRDVVLMDTAGRSPKNEMQMSELVEFLRVAQPAEIHLVLSATTKPCDLGDCLARFKDSGYNRLIFTKLDETNCYGGIFNSAQAAKCPVTYLTCGQNVPDDIEEADQGRLVDLLLGMEATSG